MGSRKGSAISKAAKTSEDGFNIRINIITSIHKMQVMGYLTIRYVLGGLHMTNIAFLPNALLKEVTGTEYHYKIPSFFNDNHDLEELNRQ